MRPATVKIDDRTREALRTLSSAEGLPMKDVLARAVEAYRRKRLLDDANRAWAALRGDEAAWRDEVAERALWDQTLGDGLDDA